MREENRMFCSCVYYAIRKTNCQAVNCFFLIFENGPLLLNLPAVISISALVYISKNSHPLSLALFANLRMSNSGPSDSHNSRIFLNAAKVFPFVSFADHILRV